MNIVIGSRSYKVTLTPEGATVDGVPFAIDARELRPGVLSLLHTAADGVTRSYRCVAEEGAVSVNGQRVEFEVADPRSLRAASTHAGAAGPRALKSPMPGRIVRVLVAVGDVVEQGQGCVVIEAMKMQNELKSPKAGRVGKLMAAVGDTVGGNAVLLVVE